MDGFFCPQCQRVNRPNVKYCAHCGTKMSAQPVANPYGTGKLPPGLILAGRYMIVAKIAQGGMGAVYEARDVSVKPAQPVLESPVHKPQRLAIKEMSFSMLGRLKPEHQKAVVEGFQREFEILSTLNHPNLVRAFHFFEEQGRQYFVMEYIEGHTLETILENQPPGRFLPIERVMEWAKQLCQVLVYLHAQVPPIIYRDLKPSNIMEVAGSHRLKLFDFGIARFYKPGKSTDTVRFGTDGYLAPEIVAQHSQTNEQTDIFALGVMLHQLLTRHDPQSGPWQHPPLRLLNQNVPERIAQAIERAMVLNPKQRTPSAVALRVDLFGSAQVLDGARSDAVPRGASSLQARPPFGTMASGQMVSPAAPYLSPADSFSAPAAVGQSPQQQPAATNVPSGIASAPVLELGAVQQGAIVTSCLQVMLPPACVGQVRSSVPWLLPEPARVTAADSRINLHVQTAKLVLASWAEAPDGDSLGQAQPGQGTRKPAWVQRLPRILRSWIEMHARFLIKLPQEHQGQVLVETPGSPIQKVTVKVTILPPSWMSLMGWLFVAGLMTLEAVLFAGLVLLILMNM